MAAAGAGGGRPPTPLRASAEWQGVLREALERLGQVEGRQARLQRSVGAAVADLVREPAWIGGGGGGGGGGAPPREGDSRRSSGFELGAARASSPLLPVDGASMQEEDPESPLAWGGGLASAADVAALFLDPRELEAAAAAGGGGGSSSPAEDLAPAPARPPARCGRDRGGGLREKKAGRKTKKKAPAREAPPPSKRGWNAGAGSPPPKGGRRAAWDASVGPGGSADELEVSVQDVEQALQQCRALPRWKRPTASSAAKGLGGTLVTVTAVEAKKGRERREAAELRARRDRERQRARTAERQRAKIARERARPASASLDLHAENLPRYARQRLRRVKGELKLQEKRVAAQKQRLEAEELKLAQMRDYVPEEVQKAVHRAGGGLFVDVPPPPGGDGTGAEPFEPGPGTLKEWGSPRPEIGSPVVARASFCSPEPGGPARAGEQKTRRRKIEPTGGGGGRRAPPAKKKQSVSETAAAWEADLLNLQAFLDTSPLLGDDPGRALSPDPPTLADQIELANLNLKRQPMRSRAERRKLRTPHTEAASKAADRKREELTKQALEAAQVRRPRECRRDGEPRPSRPAPPLLTPPPMPPSLIPPERTDQQPAMRNISRI